MTTPNQETQPQEGTLAPTDATAQGGDDDARVAAAIAALSSGEADDPGGDPSGSDAPTGEEDTPEPSDDDRPSAPDPDPEPAELESSRLAELSRRERRQREQGARREQELAAREQRIVARERELESELVSLRSQLSNQADAFFNNPIEALKAMGVKSGFGDLAHVLMAAELGEEPPMEHLSGLQNRRMETALERQRREMDEKLAEIENRRKQAEIEEFQRSYATSLDGYARTVQTSDMPFLRVWYDSEPTEVLEMMYADAVDLASEDPSGPLPTPQNLAKRLNQRLESKIGPIIAKLIELELARSEEPPPAPKSQPASTTTLRNAHSRRTNRNAPAQSEEERVRRAIAALDDPAHS